jgi:hypothetical protein
MAKAMEHLPILDEHELTLRIVDSISIEFDRQASVPNLHEPAGHDVIYRSICTAFSLELAQREESPVFNVLYEAMKTRRVENEKQVFKEKDKEKSIRPSNEVNRLIRAYQAAKLYSKDPDYPKKFTNPKRIQDDLVRFCAGSTEGPVPKEARIFYHCFVRYDTQSNIPQRAKALKLGFMALRKAGLIEQYAGILDLGTSQAKTLKMLSLQRSFEPVTVYTEGDQQHGFPVLEIDSKRSQKIKRLLADKSVQFGPLLGIDQYNMNDPMNKFWSKSCSFYPKELLRPKTIELYDSLENTVEEVKFAQANITDPVGMRNAIEKDRYSVANFSAVLDQLTLEDQAEALSIAFEHADNVIVSDFMYFDDSSPSGINFKDTWQAEPYVTSLVTQSNEGFIHEPLFEWTSGRCMGMIPNLGSKVVKNLLTVR